MAVNANNHFGVKCGSDWSGGVSYREDDDRDHRGKLIKSCFRVYDSAEESFIAHSDFLRNNGKSSRYEFLFNFESNDYKNWAHGLKKAGYATDPKYPKKLINLIEKYELYRYDDMGSANYAHFVAQSPDQKKQSKTESRILNDQSTQRLKSKNALPDYDYHNDVKMILSRPDQSLRDIAEDFGMGAATLMKYNDGISSSDKSLKDHSRIYLEQKKLSFKGKRKFHQISKGETMASISQHYAVDLQALYIRNKMPFGSEPFYGETIQLKGLIRSGKRPKLKSKAKSSIAKKSRFVEETVEYLFTPKHADRD